jgi:hypothetical protein
VVVRIKLIETAPSSTKFAMRATRNPHVVFKMTVKARGAES